MVEIDLWSMISGSSLLIKIVLVILGVMSVTSWSVISSNWFNWIG